MTDQPAIPDLSAQLVERIKTAAAISGLAESTICNRLFNQSRLPVSARSRAEKTRAQIERLDGFILAHLGQNITTGGR